MRRRTTPIGSMRAPAPPGGAPRTPSPAALPPRSRAATWASTSSRVIRPPSPVPATADRSTSCSAASRRTTGDNRALGAAGPGAGPAVPAGDGSAAGEGRSAGTAGAATASPAAPITATTELTGTVSPARARICSSTPPTGAGTSASTLSVDISNSGSSRSTVSPTRLVQRTIVPSAIDSPICGISTSVGIRRVPERSGTDRTAGWKSAP